ncbi:MAG: Spy/CpxP family protein refolding chaperone [Chitinophagaceae bacterium]|nr:Spy/CpxP family protein refolding chaperone [Chitinophagaceae bacterium]MBK8951161.1 Spy/CpxP family protein refolding chaperone [Chitinophagaceae bacterium]
MKNSNKILSITVVLLLLANIALVVMLVTGNGFGHKSQNKRIDPAEMMAKELGLNEQQKASHKLLKEEHMKTMKPLFDSLREVKSAFYMLTKEQELSDSLLNAYGHTITDLQIRIDKATFAHFKKVRAMLTPEQQPKFDTLVKKMMTRSKRSDQGKTDKKP